MRAPFVPDEAGARPQVKHSVDLRPRRLPPGRSAVFREAAFVLRPEAVEHEASRAADAALRGVGAVAAPFAVRRRPGEREDVEIEVAGRLSAEAARLAQLTSRIMNLSRLQAADEFTDEREVAVDEIVASAAEAHAIQAGSAGVEIVRGGDRGLYVRGDAQVLSEAVGNLIANAIAYSPRGSNVGVGVKAVDAVVEIAVTDRGIGIAEGDQERVFERFYRADQARSRRTGGTGLGLAIVKHAVQRHGGEVRLWSRPGRGSTFTIRLPLIDPPADQVQPKRRRPKKKKGTPAPASHPTNGAPA